MSNEPLIFQPESWAKARAETKAYLRALPLAPPGMVYFVIFGQWWGRDRNANRAAAEAFRLPGHYWLHLVNEEAEYHAHTRQLHYRDMTPGLQLNLKLLFL